MTVQSTKFNAGLSNISWYRGYATPSISTTQRTNNLIVGNPNKPEVLNDNPDAGVVRTFDSRKCFGYELT